MDTDIDIYLNFGPCLFKLIFILVPQEKKGPWAYNLNKILGKLHTHSRVRLNSISFLFLGK